MTDHIKILPVAPRIAYVGNGAQTQFTFPFGIFKSTDLVISLDGAVQTGGFVISGAGQSNGGTVTFTTAPANNQVILLERLLVLQRVSDFLEGGEFAANSLNNELDYLAGCIQQIAYDMTPMVRAAKTETNFINTLPAKNLRTNKVLGFDGDGQFQVIDTTATYATPTFYTSGTGAVTRTFLDKGREIVSVKDYGAVGDGITNDTNAFINAITANKAVHVPPGTYLITQTLEIGSNIMLFGTGKSSIIKANATSFDVIALIGSHSIMSNLVIDGGDSGVFCYGKTAPCQHNIVQNVTIKNANIGIELDGYTSAANFCRWNNFLDVSIDRFAVDGVYVHLSGAGDAPMANKFQRVKVTSGAINSTGYGFNITASKFNTSFIECEAVLATTALAGFRSGVAADKNVIINFFAQSTGSMPGIKLEAGSTDTAISHLGTMLTSGIDINDLSSGSYTTLNGGTTEKNRLRRTRISDLTTELQRYYFQTVTASGVTNITADLTKSTYLINASGGVTTLQLPTAAAGNSGVSITVKKTDTSSNLVSIIELAGNGPDGRTLKLGGANDYATVLSDGTKWLITGTNTMPSSTQAYSGGGTYKPDLTRGLYMINATTGLTIVELPPANAAQSIGRIVSVKKSDGTANTVRVTEEGAAGPDNAACNLTAQYQSVTVMSNGSLWLILSKY